MSLIIKRKRNLCKMHILNYYTSFNTHSRYNGKKIRTFAQNEQIYEQKY